MNTGTKYGGARGGEPAESSWRESRVGGGGHEMRERESREREEDASSALGPGGDRVRVGSTCRHGCNLGNGAGRHVELNF